MTDSTTKHDEFYAGLTERNQGLIPAEWQKKLRSTRFVIAGCGSTGGACVMPLVRSGAERFVLMDPGSYELNNLNRQDATLAELGQNKARATAERILAINPYAHVAVFEDGVTSDIESRLVAEDVIIDAVDVTADSGVVAKLALHQAACKLKLKVVTAYDIAATQFLEMFDYQEIAEPLDGRIRGAPTSERVLKSLIPPLVLPREIFPELLARRREPDRGFPQLMMTSTLLGALIVPYLLQVLDGRPVRKKVRIDLYDVTRPLGVRWIEKARRNLALAPLWWRLRARAK
jgi:molybdopterin-synthase adenylyltransferase